MKRPSEISSEFGELEQELQKVLDQSIRKPGGPLRPELPKRGTLITSGRIKRIRELEKKNKQITEQIKVKLFKLVFT